MADAKQIRQAQEVYVTLCEMLDERNWHYEKDLDELNISCGVQGDDIPMPIRITVEAERQIILLFSHLPFDIPEDKRAEMALAVTLVNYKLVNGCFDFSPSKGTLLFRMVSSFRDCVISPDLLAYMMDVSCGTVDEYNEKLQALADGSMTFSQFKVSIDE